MTTLIASCNYSKEELECLESFLLDQSGISFITLRLPAIISNHLTKVATFPIPIISWPEWRIKADVRTGMSVYDSTPRDLAWWTETYIDCLNEGLIDEDYIDLSDYSLYDLVLLKGSRI